MNNLDSYKSSLDEVAGKIKNNCNYFSSFGDVYVSKKIKEYLDNIYSELQKVKELIDEVDKKD